MPSVIVAVIKPFKLEEVKEAIRGAGVLGLTVSEVQGFGRQGGKSETFRGSGNKMEFVPKVRIEVLVETSQVDKFLEVTSAAAGTGKFGEGKIWASAPARLMRTRPGGVGDDAVCPVAAGTPSRCEAQASRCGQR